ncbi:MAG: hypothetical protein HY081_12005 [Gammaproteobacteria bacterium]|nr:hypothetical protein [Gammaproteobacteria bacterium]
MGLSNYTLEQMGFELIPHNVHIEAYFKSINVYEIRGITFDNNSHFVPGELKSVAKNVSFSIGDGVNAVCEALIGDKFSEDEEKWRLETKSTPPYLIVLTSLTEFAICRHGYWKHENNEIITHNCFTEAKKSLQKLEHTKTSALVTSLSAAFSSVDRPVFFLPLSREVFAETNHGKRLRDFRFSFSAEGYVSSSVTSETVSIKFESALKIFEKLHPKVGYFFDQAIREKDNLKRFIYYFLVIEIYTHSIFNKMEDSFKVSDMRNLPDRIEKSVTELLISQLLVDQVESKNLLQRFIWCAIIRWNEIDDSDIDVFKLLKNTRNSIYHGEEVIETSLPIHQAQSLALKLLRS